MQMHARCSQVHLISSNLFRQRARAAAEQTARSEEGGWAAMAMVEAWVKAAVAEAAARVAVAGLA